MSFNSFREDCQAVLLLLSNLLYHILYNDAKSRARSRWNLYGAYETHVLPPKYHSLKANEIRILALLPSTDRTARLQGRFETYNLDNDNEASSKADQNGYEAVFYNRTTPRTMGSIVIESKIVFIPLDLQRALFWLRYTHEERRLWADAICINDSDPLEEFTQISLFSQIYKRATKAIAWIGEVKEAEEEAYRPFLEALQHPGSFLLFLRSGGLAHISGFKVLIEPFRLWKLIRNKRASLCRELMLAGKISFKLERYDIPGRFLDSLMWKYNEVMKLQRSERSTSTLFTPDTSGALRVKAFLIDYIEDVGDIDEEEQYDNGPFPKPWVTLGAIEELLTMLRRSDKGLVSRKTLKNLSSLLDRAYSQSEQDPNPSYRLEAYNTYGTLIRQVKKATRGHRLIKTAHLSRLGLASPSVQKKDAIFFVPEHSALLILRAFHQLSTQPLDAQQYYTLTGACYMGDTKYWSKEHPHLANAPLRTVYLMPATQEKEVQWNDKSSAKPNHFVIPNRVDLVRSNFGKDIIQRKMKPDIQVENKTEKPHAAAMVDKLYRLSWTCTCGYRGLDHYTEHRPGAVRELLETLQEHGIKASMEACDSSQSSRSAARAVLERLGMTVANIYTWIRFCILAWLGIEKWTSPPLSTMHPRISDLVNDRSVSSRMTKRIGIVVAKIGVCLLTIIVLRWRVKEVVSRSLRIVSKLSDAVHDESLSSERAIIAVFDFIGNICLLTLSIGTEALLVYVSLFPSQRETYLRQSVVEDLRITFSKAAKGTFHSKVANGSPPKATSGPTNGNLPSQSSVNIDPSNSNRPLQTLTGLSRASQTTPGRQNWRSTSSTTSTQVNSTNINIPEDFILLCMKVKRFLTNRYDLQISTITRDRELFEALRREYHSKFRWIYRQFSFQTVQRMSFVKFTLHARKEVDGLVYDMPPEAVKHYTCDPRKPDRTPALGSDFLMHRFSSPKDCFQDNICLRQFPKRIGERPTPGVDPDLYTGWGVHLEQDMDLQRICLVLFFGIASAGTFGLVWGICKKSLQDGFSIASFILGSEAIAVATLQLFLSFGAI